MVRLGNQRKVSECLDYIKELYERTQKISVYDKTLERNRSDKIEGTRKLTALLKKHETLLDLNERKEAIEKLLSSNKHLTFQADLQARQLEEVNRKIKSLGRVTDAEALSLLEDDEEEFFKYLYFTSAKYIKRLGEQKAGFVDILNIDDKEVQLDVLRNISVKMRI